jgi:plasmid stability protein
MPQLIVRQIDEEIVRKLKARAGREGISMEEAHRRILRESLLNKPRRLSFKQHLLAMPEGGPDELFERNKDLGR